jgi:cytochrome c oxidase subunit IV
MLISVFRQRTEETKPNHGACCLAVLNRLSTLARWRQNVCQKRCSLNTRQHVVTIQTTRIWVFTTVTSTNLIKIIWTDLGRYCKWVVLAHKFLYRTAGLILSGVVHSWTERLNRLRLSQLLDMYYSHRGVNFDPKYRACERQARLKELEGTDDLLPTQVKLDNACYFSPYCCNSGVNLTQSAALVTSWMPGWISHRTRGTVTDADTVSIHHKTESYKGGQFWSQISRARLWGRAEEGTGEERLLETHTNISELYKHCGLHYRKIKRY